MAMNDNPRFLPQVILAGAPKCGTSSVFRYLEDHPQICASLVKETYYLMDNNYPLYRQDANIAKGGWGGYEQFFPAGAGDGSRLRVEATPDYLYQQTPLKEIPYWPVTPKVIFILRSPEERMFSLYRFAQNNLSNLDKDISFSRFVAMVENAAPELSGRLILSSAIAHSRYVNYLVAWRNALGNENIGIFLFESFRNDPRAFMAEIASFLQINPCFYDNYEFKVINRSYTVRFQRAHRIKRLLGPYLNNRALRRIMGSWYRKANVVQMSEMTEQDRSTASRLARQFVESNRKLEKEFALDLSSWQDAGVR